MGFIEAFIQCMQEQGLQADAGQFPQEKDAVQSVVDSVKSVYNSLSAGEKAGLDVVATNDEGAGVLLDAGAQGAEGIVSVINAATGWDVGSVLQYCDYCLEQAAAAAENEGTEGQTEQEA